MIQIIGLRSYTDKTGKQRTKHQHFSNAASISELFGNIEQFTATLPEDERYNLYYTALDCVDPKMVGGALRKFKSQSVIPFDIDNIDLEKITQYIEIFFKVTGLDDSKCAIVATGNGLQILVQLKEAFTDENYFNEKRDHYKETCIALDAAFAAADLPGDADPAVWSGARLLRLPNTENRKPKKGIKQAKLMFSGLMPQEFTWIEPAIPSNSEKENLEGTHKNSKDDRTRSSASFGAVDHKEIFQKCGFMKWTQSKPEEVREPAFYAALSVLSRMEKGEDKCRALFDKIKASGSDSSVGAYAEGEYQDKLKAALENAKPRTCKNIDSVMGWAGKCKSCPAYGTVKSPISLKGEAFIRSKNQGFYKWEEGKKPVPQYEDLMKFFDQKYHFKVMDKSQIVMVWKDNYYKEYSEVRLRSFAEKHFNPSPLSNIIREFELKIKRNDVVDPKFFEDDTNGLVNFKNGVFDIHNDELNPHTPDYGFRYILPYEHDSKAECPKFMKFIDEVCCGDEELKSVLQEFMGYVVSGDEYWTHQCLLLVGSGSNGKGVFTRVLEAVVGAENCSGAMIKDLLTSPNSRQRLEGKTLNISDEVSAKELTDTGLFKALTGNGIMEVKKMWHQPYEIRNRAKLVMNCNQVPQTQDDSDGFLRRFCLIPFDRKFEAGKDVDPFLFKKLVEELPGIFNYAIKGYKRLYENKAFTAAKASVEKLNDMSGENNAVRYWIEDQAAVTVHKLNGRTKFVPTDVLFEGYQEWAIGKGRKESEIGIREFGKMMAQAVEQGEQRKGRKEINGVRKRGFFDIEIDRARKNGSH